MRWTGRGRRRRLVVVTVLVLIALVGAAYGVLVLVTPDPPPPPRFGRDTTARFAPELDGFWYAAGCRRVRILGGWFLPGPGFLVGPTRRALPIHEPIDLTGLRADGRPKSFSLSEARLSIRWLRGGASDRGQPGARPRSSPARSAQEGGLLT